MVDLKELTDKIAEALYEESCRSSNCPTSPTWDDFKTAFPIDAQVFIFGAEPLAKASYEAGKAEGIKTVVDFIRKYLPDPEEYVDPEIWQSFLKDHEL